MNITIATEAEERVYTDKAGIEWRYMVLPARGDEVLQAMREAGVRKLGEDDEPGMLLATQRMALGKVTAITGASCDGEKVGINGKDVTDPSVLALVLGTMLELAQHAGNEAVLLGQRVDGERGNLQPAPVSQPSTPQQQDDSGAPI